MLLRFNWSFSYDSRQEYSLFLFIENIMILITYVYAQVELEQLNQVMTKTYLLNFFMFEAKHKWFFCGLAWHLQALNGFNQFLSLCCLLI